MAAEGNKILVTGATGQVVRQAVYDLAETNDVWCLGRFGDPDVRGDLEKHGVTLAHWNMTADTQLKDVPSDFDYVLHAAVLRENYSDFAAAIDVNCIAAATIMQHCRDAKAFIHVSTSGVYKEVEPEHLYLETDALGGARGTMHEAYGIGKLAAEGTVGALCRLFDLPTVIARMNVAVGPYGHGGVVARFFKAIAAGEAIPVPADHSWYCSPIHTDDVARQVPLFWEAASVPANTINWGGDDKVVDREIMSHITDIAGLELKTVVSDQTLHMTASEPTKRLSITGPCKVGWREAIRRAMEAHFPDSVKN